MEADRNQPFDSSVPPRRFVYREANGETNLAHPLRRATDTSQPFQGIPAQLFLRAQVLKFRVYLKAN